MTWRVPQEKGNENFKGQSNEMALGKIPLRLVIYDLEFQTLPFEVTWKKVLRESFRTFNFLFLLFSN